MKANEAQVNSATEWATEWGEVRRQAIKHHRQQRLELRMQEADPKVIVQHNEAWSYLLASIRSLETASRLHASTLRGRL